MRTLRGEASADYDSADHGYIPVRDGTHAPAEQRMDGTSTSLRLGSYETHAQERNERAYIESISHRSRDMVGR